MKIILGAIALTFAAAPALSQTAPAPDAHAAHQSADHSKMDHSKMDHSKMECCKDGKHDCCKDGKMDCCAKHKAAAKAAAPADHHGHDH